MPSRWPPRLQLGYALIKRAELHWSRGEFPDVLPLYEMSIAIFEQALQTQCKQVCQLRSWVAVTHMHLKKYKEAKKWNNLAEELVRGQGPPSRRPHP